MKQPYTRTFTALPDHIDALGHVNNAVWVGWVQDIATDHWEAAARSEDIERFFWVVIRHEIDYRGNIAEGESVSGATWIEGAPRGAKSDRIVQFTHNTGPNAGPNAGSNDGSYSGPNAGKVIISARTTWAMMERASGRLARVREEIIAPFRSAGSE